MNIDSNKLLRKRCNSYRLLAACFYEPQRNIFEKGTLQDLAESLQDICPAAADYAAAMIKMLQEYSEEELLVDYARLFVGPSELLAPPYGSVYLEKEGRLMGDSTMAAVDFYRSRGLVMDADFREVPDHIAAELEFMYYLVYKEIEALEASDMKAAAAALEAQDSFMHVFLLRWVDKFSGRIAENADTDFYRALAGCLSSFIYKSDTYDRRPDELRAAALPDV